MASELEIIRQNVPIHGAATSWPVDELPNWWWRQAEKSENGKKYSEHEKEKSRLDNSSSGLSSTWFALPECSECFTKLTKPYIFKMIDPLSLGWTRNLKKNVVIGN